VSATPSPLKSVIGLPMLVVPGCDSAAVWPAMVTLPLRGVAAPLAVAVNVTVPLPSTDVVGLVTATHDSALDAVQLHADVVVTLTCITPPATPTACVSGAIV